MANAPSSITGLPTPIYDKVVSLLEKAGDACRKAPGRDVVGLSAGPFSGVNATLGIVSTLEYQKQVYERILDDVVASGVTDAIIKRIEGAKSLTRAVV